MAQPRDYNRNYNFTDYQTTNPSDPLPAAQVDAEFNDVKLTLDDLNENIGLIQRDDGKLANNAVHKEAFSQDALALVTAGSLTPRGSWASSTVYAVADIVDFNDATYLATVGHTAANAFATDLSAGNWILIANAAIAGGASSVDKYEGDGNTTAFSLSYSYTSDTDVLVFVNGALRNPGDDYSISGTTITFVTAPSLPAVAGNENVIIWGSSVVVEAAKQAAQAAQANAQGYANDAQDWAEKTSGPVTGTSYSSKYWATSTPVTTVATNISDVQTVATDIANVNTVAADLAGYDTTGTVAANITDVNTVAGIDSDVSTVAGISSDVTTVATYAANVTTVASDIQAVVTAANDLNEAVSEIDTVANSIANVNTVGTNIANVNTVGGISSNVTTVAGISSDVTAVAGNNANVTTVAGISGNVTTVAGISGNVTTVAGDSADIQALAAITSDVSTAAASITEITDFNDRFTASATAPASPQNGDLWYDTANSSLKIYVNTSWQVAGAYLQGLTSTHVFTATASQTTFTTDDAGNTMTIYANGNTLVFRNGIRLVEGTSSTNDYYISGNDVILNSGADAGDVLYVEVFTKISTTQEASLNTLVSNASTSASNAASSASAASTSASNAATSESNASTSESNAASSATSAASSATSAASSAAAAAASYDDFDDRFLGAKSSSPSTDNDGNSLLTGAIYWDTTANGLYIYDGSVWQQGAFSAGSLLANVVEDTTPQLGGNLDVVTSSIVSTSGRDINITPDTTGSVVIDGISYPQADGTNGQFLQTDGAGTLSFATVSTPTLSSLGLDNHDQVSVDASGNVSLGSSSISFGSSAWSIVLDGTDLDFRYNGTTVFKLSSAGAVVAADDITAFGTP